MRTTQDLPEDLVEEAMRVTHARTKTEMIKLALISIVNQKKRNRIVDYHGKVDLDIDLDIMRKR